MHINKLKSILGHIGAQAFIEVDTLNLTIKLHISKDGIPVYTKRFNIPSIHRTSNTEIEMFTAILLEEFLAESINTNIILAHDRTLKKNEFRSKTNKVKLTSKSDNDPELTKYGKQLDSATLKMIGIMAEKGMREATFEVEGEHEGDKSNLTIRITDIKEVKGNDKV